MERFYIPDKLNLCRYEPGEPLYTTREGLVLEPKDLLHTIDSIRRELSIKRDRLEREVKTLTEQLVTLDKLEEDLNGRKTV